MDDPLGEPDPSQVIEQKNQEIYLLRKQLQESQSSFQVIVEKLNRLELQHNSQEKGKNKKIPYKFQEFTSQKRKSKAAPSFKIIQKRQYQETQVKPLSFDH
ncbi:hypothetical protein O181_088191 [Austropuccinia psidii MF-1]|uniref:Uncharacterized protein n=1 Tax=Austropuccinia psidii MF-1 TaxID=1389203 RepID=A0A9Q3IR45_9BASI|nr:hypothetical protein [Austropuccinia psidii MF-1]